MPLHGELRIGYKASAEQFGPATSSSWGSSPNGSASTR